MAKNLKLNVKNAQLAEALKLGKIKKKKKVEPPKATPSDTQAPVKKARSLEPLVEKPKEEETKPTPKKVEAEAPPPPPVKKKVQAKDAPSPLPPKPKPKVEEKRVPPKPAPSQTAVFKPKERTGGIGFIRPGTDKKARQEAREISAKAAREKPAAEKKNPAAGGKPGDDRSRFKSTAPPPPQSERPKKTTYAKENRPSRRTILTEQTTFDSRHRQGLKSHDDEGWRRRRPGYKQKQKRIAEIPVIRPNSLSVKLPITIKDLAVAMKYKAAELISKLFMQGIVVTINDHLDDETIVQLLGQEFGCEITIDTSEAERLQITDKTISEEIAEDESALEPRAPVVAFMGHVDHGKTSLIDKIRESNIASGEAGAITQHIGAFRANVREGALTILDTPGHEAFTAMRSRGATVTDIVVLVVAGDEGIKPQTEEAIQQALDAKVPMVVAINKCDKPDFNADNVYRQLADRNLLPESWGGEILTVNVSAHTSEGLPNLLEILYLQSEMLELKANPKKRARGTVLESELKKGLGINATLLIQNGTLKLGDALVIDNVYGRVKTMHDENGKNKKSASPSFPVEITGISDQPEAGCEFIVVSSEKEAKKLCEERLAKKEHRQLMKGRSLESIMQRSEELSAKKVLNIILKADVQGSLEAVRESLLKIKSDKAEVNIIASDVGEIAESDIEYAAASNAVIIGFHTSIQSHAEPMIGKLKVKVKLHDVIYHIVDDAKEMMIELLDKVRVETECGAVEIRQIFKSSALGTIAGCSVTDGVIRRINHLKLYRNDEIIWEGEFNSLKRGTDDTKEVKKGFECGLLLKGFSDYQVGDIVRAFDITYVTAEL